MRIILALEFVEHRIAVLALSVGRGWPKAPAINPDPEPVHRRRRRSAVRPRISIPIPTAQSVRGIGRAPLAAGTGVTFEERRARVALM